MLADHQRAPFQRGSNDCKGGEGEIADINTKLRHLRAMRSALNRLVRHLSAPRRDQRMSDPGEPRNRAQSTSSSIRKLATVLRNIVPTHPDPEGLLFTTPDGAPIDQANFRQRVWNPMLRRLGLGVRHPYATRHAYISFMLAAGAYLTALAIVHMLAPNLEPVRLES